MIVLSWLKSRIIEPTSWIAIGLGAVIISIAIPDIAIYLLIAAAVTVALGVIMKERGDGGRRRDAGQSHQDTRWRCSWHDGQGA